MITIYHYLANKIKAIYLMAGLFSFFPLTVFAEAKLDTQDNNAVLYSHFGEMLFSLILVIALIFGLTWVVKKLRPAQFNQVASNQLHILANMPVSSQVRLLLIRVGKQDVLISVSNHQANLLVVLDEPLDDIIHNDPPQQATKLFDLLLKKGSKNQKKL